MGLLKCPYHGWAFSGTGQCQHIPQQEEGGMAHCSKRACVLILHYQERYLESKGGNANFAKALYMPTKSDRYMVALRRWMKQYSIDPFAGKSLSATLPDDHLPARYHTHAKLRACLESAED